MKKKSKPESTQIKVKLAPIKKQFNRTWKLFVSGWWKFLLIIGLPFYIASISRMIILPLMGSSMDDKFLVLVLGYLVVIAGIAYVGVYFIVQAGMIYSLDKVETISVKEAYRKGADYALSLFWVMVLVGLMVMVGWVLLIVPGIIFLIRYTFAPFAMIYRGEKGWAALKESRELVRGYWWAVFGRLILFYIIMITVQIQAGFLLPTLHPNLISMIIQPLLNIFIIIYTFVIFQDLVAIKNPETPSPSETPSMSSPSLPADS